MILSMRLTFRLRGGAVGTVSTAQRAKKRKFKLVTLSCRFSICRLSLQQMDSVDEGDEGVAEPAISPREIIDELQVKRITVRWYHHWFLD